MTEEILRHFSEKGVSKIFIQGHKTLYFTVVSTEAGAEAAGAAAAPAAAASVSEYKVFVTLNENFVNSFP